MFSQSFKKKVAFLKNFNETLVEFLAFMVQQFPGEKVIEYAKHAFELLIQGKANIVLTYWYTFVYQEHKSYIENGDLDYFLNFNYEVYAMEKQFLDMINAIRQPISNRLGDTVLREKVIEYLKTLNDLSENYTMTR